MKTKHQSNPKRYKKPVREIAARVNNLNLRENLLLFLGAGAARGDELADQDQLPLGNEVMEELLGAAYPGREAHDAFRDEYGANTISPDEVWRRLIDDKHAQRIRSFVPVFERLFAPSKPIPNGYLWLAKWYVPRAHRGTLRVVTTNYDEHIDRAFDMATGRAGRVVGLAADIQFYQDLNTSHYPVIKLHGTVSHPWSLGGPTGRDIKAGGEIGYEPLRSLLKWARLWVFVGYSFKNSDLVKLLKESCNRIQREIWIVDVDPDEALLRLGEIRAKISLVQDTAGAFFEQSYLASDALTPNALISDPFERAILVTGPKTIRTTKPEAAPHNGGTNLLRISDPVHSSIYFTPPVAERMKRIIDSGEIQRLRNIRQLSFVNYRFPTAVHDRFQHVLGVAHLGGKVFELLKHQCTGEYYRSLHDIGLFSEIAHIQLCAAALLHDIGHGPFGHAMDLVFKSIGEDKDHVTYTKHMLLQAGERHSFVDLERALDSAGIGFAGVEEIIGDTHLFSPILSNQGLDIDRADFVLRDSLYLDGDMRFDKETTLGGLRAQVSRDLDSMLRAFSFRKVSNEWKIGLGLSVRDKVVRFAQLYSFLYQNVYHCKENISAQHMLASATISMIKADAIELRDVMSRTDIQLSDMLSTSGSRRARELAVLVKYRRLFPRILAIRFSTILGKEEVEGLRGTLNTVVERIAEKHGQTVFLDLRSAKSLQCAFWKDEETECRTVDAHHGGQMELLERRAILSHIEIGQVPGLVQVFSERLDEELARELRTSILGELATHRVGFEAL